MWPVEGAACRDHCHGVAHDPVGRVVDAGEDLGGWYPPHRHALRAKPCVAPRVPLRAVLDLVAPPVDLNREARPGAIEVEHVRPDRMLATERRHCGRPRPQPAPKHCLGGGKCAAKLSGCGNGVSRRSHEFRPSPSTGLRSPSPASQGRITPGPERGQYSPEIPYPAKPRGRTPGSQMRNRSFGIHHTSSGRNRPIADQSKPQCWEASQTPRPACWEQHGLEMGPGERIADDHDRRPRPAGRLNVIAVRVRRQ